jgi:mRNA interferase MazF
MSPGQIVTVDWRDALPGTGEPNKHRPGIVVSSAQFFDETFPFKIVVPLTAEEDLAIEGASTLIEPTPSNGCTKRCYALAWNVQTVPHKRLTTTPSTITDEQLARIRAQVAACVDIT